MDLKNKNIGLALTGSYCTFDLIFGQFEQIVEAGADATAILSYHAAELETRFITIKDLYAKLEEITGKPLVDSIVKAEPIGPQVLLDAVVIAPATGNTLAKLANGITDTPVLMAAKAAMRNGNPVVLAIATNDGLGANGQNIGKLLNTKNIFFVPFGQDGHTVKANSLQSNMEMIKETLEFAMEGKQKQPVILGVDEVFA
ncbi:MAG: dipicolinate synthase subunit B [Eubacteriaceae bacterium]|nr:dipicolinate synthase subunit B [Eubacteriaceae bacterium]